MVSVALFTLAKLVTQSFGRNAELMLLVRTSWSWLGAATAIIGGLMAFCAAPSQTAACLLDDRPHGRHADRNRADNANGLGNFVLYLFGHGLIKSSLFMIAGIVLALANSADEIRLYQQGRSFWPAGVAMGIAGLLLGGFPVGMLHEATDAFASGWSFVAVSIMLATSLTGAAVLRAVARIFAGLSGAPGAEITAPTEPEREKGDRPLR